MRGVFNKRPALPKYRSTWNPDSVLSYLASLDSEITLIQLSQKVCTLLLLLTGQRGQTIHLLKLADISFKSSSLEICFSSVLKHTRPGVHQENIVLQAFPDNKALCIVSLLHLYIKRTEVLRGNETKLLITTQPPFKAIARATLSRWVKTVLHKSGIDVKQFKPHSTRAAATSDARKKGMPLLSIMKAAGWSQSSTFRRFYDKPVHNSSSFQTAVLQK